MLGLLALNQILHIVKLGLKIFLSIVNAFGAILSIIIVNLIIFEKWLGFLPDHEMVRREYFLDLVLWLNVSSILHQELCFADPPLALSDLPVVLLKIPVSCPPSLVSICLLGFLLGCP